MISRSGSGGSPRHGLSAHDHPRRARRGLLLDRCSASELRSLMPLFVDTETVTCDGVGMAPVKNLVVGRLGS